MREIEKAEQEARWEAGIQRKMENKASDGAYFTRPPAADIACRLTLDILESHPPKHLAEKKKGSSVTLEKKGSSVTLVDWTSAEVWRGLKIMDPAVGSGTLLAAILAEMKRRARDGFDKLGFSPERREEEVAALQRIAVEECLAGMDINPVSLQLAAAQLTLGNRAVKYEKMRLHLMPYGPQPDGSVKAGALELLGQKAIVARSCDLPMKDERPKSKSIKLRDDADLEDAVQDAKDCRIVICNPPFTSREKMGEKFKTEFQKRLRLQVDGLAQMLIDNDPEIEKAVHRSSIGALFEMFPDKVLDENGIFTMLTPTIALTNHASADKRIILAKRFHVHTIITVHDPRDINLSQDVNINESILIMRRCAGKKPPTRFINLDRFPNKTYEVEDFYQFLTEMNGRPGRIRCEWGEVSFWPSERIERGDWTPAIWRSPKLAEAAAQFAEDESLKSLGELELAPKRTDISSALFQKLDFESPGSFPSIYSKSEDSQDTIQSKPDQHWIPKTNQAREESKRLLAKSSHLLITHGQRNNTARLTAVAGDEKYIGMSFMPVPGLTADEAKALAVFLNSTPGRMQILRNVGRTLPYPLYNPACFANIRVPDVAGDLKVREVLLRCWEETKNIRVPQYRSADGLDDPNRKTRRQKKKTASSLPLEVSAADEKKKGASVTLENPRPLWDLAVSKALAGNPLFAVDRLNSLRHLLHREPHISGKSYNHRADEWEKE